MKGARTHTRGGGGTTSAVTSGVAVLKDANIRTAWESYHLKNAQLRLISKTCNLKLLKPSMPWGGAMQPLVRG